jgi:hypothetical protein
LLRQRKFFLACSRETLALVIHSTTFNKQVPWIEVGVDVAGFPKDVMPEGQTLV